MSDLMDWDLAMSTEVQEATSAAIGRIVRQGGTGDLEDDDLRQEAAIWVASNPAEARKSLSVGYLPNLLFQRLSNVMRAERRRHGRNVSMTTLAVQE